MKKTVLTLMAVVLLIMTFPLATFAEGDDSSTSNTEVVGEKKSNSIFIIPEKKGILEQINEPVDLNEAAEKAEQVGNQVYALLQKNSVTYLVISLGVGLVLLILGIFFRTMRKVAGMAIFFGILGFMLMNFAPELVNGMVQWIDGAFHGKQAVQ